MEKTDGEIGAQLGFEVEYWPVKIIYYLASDALAFKIGAPALGIHC